MSKSIEQRAVAAVKAVAVARAEVEQLTKAIGAELAKCPGVKGGLVFVHEPGRTPFQIDPEDITHLKLAYTPEVRTDWYGSAALPDRSMAEPRLLSPNWAAS